MEKHKSAVYGTIYAYIPWNYETDDIAHEVFIYARYNYGKINDEMKFGSWLCGIARNTALKHLRSTRFSLPFDHVCDRLKSAGPEVRYIQNESRREIMDAATGLSKPIAETITAGTYREVKSAHFTITPRQSSRGRSSCLPSMSLGQERQSSVMIITGFSTSLAMRLSLTQTQSKRRRGTFDNCIHPGVARGTDDGRYVVR